MQKTDALTDAFESLILDFTCVTETWFKGGKELEEMLTDIEGASGIRFIHKSRDGRGRSKVAEWRLPSTRAPAI